MEHSLLLLHSEDIVAAQQVLRDLPGCEVCVFDPVLVDQALAAGLPNLRFRPWTDAPDYAGLQARANVSASALERALNALVGTVVGGVSILGWQHLTLYYQFLAMEWHNGQARDLLPALRGRHLHVLVCDNPASYYFNAFVPGLMALQQAAAQGITASAYSYGRKPDSRQRVPLLTGQATAREGGFLLSHLPTCVYDIHHFNDEIRASGRPLINIEAHHFGTPVAAERAISLADPADCQGAIAPDWQAQVDQIETLLLQHLQQFLSDKIPSAEFCRRQAAHTADIYRAQLLSLHLLERHFELARPAKLLLSDHDTGLHGPLLAFALRHQLPVRLLPHSKTTPDLEFSGSNVVALTHPIQGGHILDAGGRLVPHQGLMLPVELSLSTACPGPLRRVALMLNALTLSGVYFAQYQSYIAGIRQIADWCRDQGVQLDIRCKPSYSLVHLLATELGLDANRLTDNARVPMAEFAARCDLCLMYDTPTAGALDFLNKGLPILNPVVTPLTRAQAVTTHPDVLPRESITATLQRMQGFISEPVLLQRFRVQQFKRYVDLFDLAMPLRCHL